MTGAPDQLQDGAATTINVTYVYRYLAPVNGAAPADSFRVTSPKDVTADLVSPAIAPLVGRTNQAYDHTAAVQSAIKNFQEKGIIFLGEVGRNAGNGPYKNCELQLNRAHQGAHKIVVNLDGKPAETIVVGDLPGQNYDMTAQVDQVKAKYAKYDFQSMTGAPTGPQSIFDQAVVLNYATPKTRQERIVTRVIQEEDPRTDVVTTVATQKVDFSRQVTKDPLS